MIWSYFVAHFMGCRCYCFNIRAAVYMFNASSDPPMHYNIVILLFVRIHRSTGRMEP